MKKIILFVALIFSSLSFANCVRDYFDIIKADQFLRYTEGYDGLMIDSMFVDKGNAENRGQRLYTAKYVWDDNKLSRIEQADYKDGQWINYTENVNESFSLTDNGDTPKLVVYWGGEVLTDASVTINEDTLLMKESDYTILYVMSNDSLYRPHEDEVIVADPENENLCYVKSTNSYNIWDHIEITKDNETTIVKKTHYEEGKESKIMTYFYVSLNKDSSLHIQKARPLGNFKQFHYFDLKGRPAKNQHSIRVMK